MQNAQKKGNGKVLIFTGNCKGKTTSSIGLALRHLLLGGRVFIGQFMKGGRFTGETILEKHFDKLRYYQFGKSTIYTEDIKQGTRKPGIDLFLATKYDRKYAAEGLEKCVKAAKSGDYSLVVLDEINIAIGMKKVRLDEVLALLRERHMDTTVVLTGRGLYPKLSAMADAIITVSQVKHPAERGIGGRLGVEY